MWRILIVLFFVCQFSAFGQTLVENESTVVLNEKTADLRLVIDNRNQSFDDKISLELFDTKDILRQSLSSPQKIKSGKETYQISFPLGDLMKTDENNIAWFRLKYRIGDTRGIVSLSQILKDVFEIRVIATEYLFSGMTYRSRIQTIDPFRNQPTAGVSIKAEMKLELKGETESEIKLTASGETDSDGFTSLEFQIPIEADIKDADINVIGTKNGIIREVDEDLNTQGDDFILLMTTDKPIYQPEQDLKIRGILLKGSQGKVVVPNAELEFRIEDEDATVLYREKVTTSAFGIAAVSWKIPENAKLGQYLIRVKNKKSEDGEYVGYQRIKVSRYDLPNFAVTAKATKPYYLPSETQAEVEVNADYLFGKPVTKGKVRVVRENKREWNWKAQKYDIDEAKAEEGKTDEAGKYTAKFDLSEDIKDLKEENYQRFRDLNFTAYFTDLTTNRTEQRRFDVRISKEAIHVYFVGRENDNNPDLPINAYVTTFYADGSPANCSVDVKARADDSDEKYKKIQSLQTSSYGVGQLNFFRPKFKDGDDDDIELEIIAKDNAGLKGSFGGEDYQRYDDDVSFEDTDQLQIQTDKTIFKPGESIKVKLNAGFEEDNENRSPRVSVDVVSGWTVVDSFFTIIKNGKAEVKIPYQPKFKGELKIAAYFEKKTISRQYDYKTQTYYNSDSIELVQTARGIIYPTEENLKVSAEFDKETYKPSEEGKVSFSVLDSVGNAIESALGVVMFDKAVEERARTEGDFNGTFSNFSGWLGYGESIAGINVKDLNSLDLSKPIPDELQLVAEAMLYDNQYFPNIFRSNSIDQNAKSVFADYFKRQIDPIETKLNLHYKNRNFEHPQDEQSLRKILSENGVNFDDIRDPWEQKYRPIFEIDKTNDIFRLLSAGADKTFDTKDDFTVLSLNFIYFTPTAIAIDKATENFHKRTNLFIRDQKTLFAELGITELKDRFGRPYEILPEINGKYYVLKIHSNGPNGVYQPTDYNRDDFDVHFNRQDYFIETEAKINKILQTTKKLPKTEAELKTILKTNDVDLENVRDAYGEKVYVFKREFSRYADVIKEEIVSEFGKEATTKRSVITPVTQGIISYQIRSKGWNRNENDQDDFTLAEFALIIWEQTKNDPKPVYKNITYVQGAGSIYGKITDPQGAIIPGATVTATNQTSQESRSVTSSSDGEYTIANLVAGSYSVKAESSGFKNTIRTGVPVIANTSVKIDFQLEAGGMSEMVSITSDVATVDASSSSISSSSVQALPMNARSFSQLVQLSPGVAVDTNSEAEKNGGSSSSQKSTPRLREYFPETLLWQPELITNADGKATLNFKMADNITTWKLYTIATTKNGKVGVAEKEITAFQPFFVDLDPPKFLTAGDEIYLPTQVRNYTATKQKVDVTMSKADWFSFLESEPRAIATGQTKQIEVDKNSAKNAVFGFKAITPIKDGKQRVTAIATKDSDAIEKPVTVRPDGEEIVRTESQLFTNSAKFDVNFPTNALPKTKKAELKIYPNLMSHVIESVEGLLQRPYGCGEQTISSTYPNLMLLKFIKAENSLTKEALKNLKAGYERLLGYQIADGGFSYWGGKDTSDIALTAYALRFLNDAKTKIEVDEKVIENAANYLAKQQREDGSFNKKYSWETAEDSQRGKLITSYVARSLALIGRTATAKERSSTLAKALAYLKLRNSEIDEPYSLALFALASFDAGDNEEAEKIANRLRNLAKDEAGGTYWNLETNTPFYGWGTAGRIETSALVIQALLRSADQSAKAKDLIARGTIFLLKKKDRYGVWYSTQTTINVLDAFLATLTEAKAQKISVSINGEKLKEIDVSADKIEPVIISLDDKLIAANRVDITTSENSAVMSQIVQKHYIAWADSVSTKLDVNNSRAIQLDYKCDKLNAKIMENITCSVEAERIGFKGYGMLLAEIGIPPGANVSRESMEESFKNDWSLSRYDILPDRIVVYMWSKAGGSKFNFSFKPRYGIKAQTPASIVYDYYNEESRGVVSPLKFVVK
jgi:A-macroglobulin TED domain/Alpha-2-macroglobulin family/Carboxypeptidase regulatory-like domain/MG2 domain/A-macroglobulin receptor binding domain/Macroglobulin domain MG3/Alpha-2-macroglobulin bait region domain